MMQLSIISVSVMLEDHNNSQWTQTKADFITRTTVDRVANTTPIFLRFVSAVIMLPASINISKNKYNIKITVSRYRISFYWNTYQNVHVSTQVENSPKLQLIKQTIINKIFLIIVDVVRISKTERILTVEQLVTTMPICFRIADLKVHLLQIDIYNF